MGAAESCVFADSHFVRTVPFLSCSADCVALGGQLFVETIEKRHAATGIAAGITAARLASSEAPAHGPAFDEFRAGVRCYIVQLMANAALDKSGKAAAISARLLEPLTSYEPARNRT